MAADRLALGPVLDDEKVLALALADRDDEPAARRELLEETGYEAGALTKLAHGPPSAGFSSEVVTLFHATGLKRVHEVPMEEVVAWLAGKQGEGVLIDPKVYAGLFFANESSSSNST